MQVIYDLCFDQGGSNYRFYVFGVYEINYTFLVILIINRRIDNYGHFNDCPLFDTLPSINSGDNQFCFTDE